jgi:hypothetical protein
MSYYDACDDEEPSKRGPGEFTALDPPDPETYNENAVETYHRHIDNLAMIIADAAGTEAMDLADHALLARIKVAIYLEAVGHKAG